MLGASALAKLPGIKTAGDHIEFVKSMMKPLGVEPTSGAYPMQLGGIEFWRVDGVERGQEIKCIAYISAVRKGYALMFQLQAGKKTDIDKLLQVLKSLDFE